MRFCHQAMPDLFVLMRMLGAQKPQTRARAWKSDMRMIMTSRVFWNLRFRRRY